MARILAGAGGLASAGPIAVASSLPRSMEAPILEISGRIASADGDGVALFDRARLEALGTVGFRTTTPWHATPVLFEGVLMRRLMRAVGASGDWVTAYALNDLTVDLPVDDFLRFDVLLALKRDQRYMAVRDSGPLFIVYPFDSTPELRKSQYAFRSAWHIARLVVR